MLRGLPLGEAEVTGKSQGGESGDLQRCFFMGLVGLWFSPVMLVFRLNQHQTTIDLHETAWKIMLVWASLWGCLLCVHECGKWMTVLYSSFNLSFCSKVTQLQGLAPAGYSGAPAKDMHSCQLLSDMLHPSQQKYPPLASYIVSSPFSVWNFYHKSLGSSFLYSSVIKASEWKKTIVWSSDSADKWNHTCRSLWCQLVGPGTDGELLLRRSS